MRDQQPLPGHPGFYTDEYATAPKEEGVAYALVTHLPGPNRQTDIESFTSNRSAGYLGAVKWFTDPSCAYLIQQELRAATGGRMPRYYQVLLRVRFRDSVPTGIEYVLGRELK